MDAALQFLARPATIRQALAAAERRLLQLDDPRDQAAQRAHIELLRQATGAGRPVDAAVRFIAGNEDRDTLDAMRADLRAWLSGGPAPTRCQIKRALRDAWLREAAVLIPADCAWHRAQRLAECIRTFRLRRWEAWQHFSDVPARATLVDAALFRARQHGDLPTTARMLFDIIEADPSKRFGRP